MKKSTMLLLIGVLVILTLSCSLFSLQRSEEGALTMETNLSLQVITNILESAVDLSNFVNLQLELRDGYVFVQADSVQFQGIAASNVTFHIELLAVNGRLAGQITNLNVSGNLINESMLENYNQILSERLVQASQQSERAVLQSVSVSPEGVKMVWLIDPQTGN